jgi:hypothetical protein
VQRGQCSECTWDYDSLPADGTHGVDLLESWLSLVFASLKHDSGFHRLGQGSLGLFSPKRHEALWYMPVIPALGG